MAKPRPEMKAEPAANATTRVLPMKLKVGDHITDETGEGRPRRQAMMLLGRASLVIMLVVMLALLALVRPIAALDASPSAILTNPAGFDGKSVTIWGTITNLRETVSRRGKVKS